ncbi:uncharacterized protein LOC111379604 isoform X1 [Olea europaea var. sylvestris]|uniref:uncharacterized protein LOC111379604 isoform X1 n=2 Tax=Olea europaea var. sylvestris TaxID=158386 RepID=UPI000C1D746F|nr:uncharacterized protein LOC111379604 isoform X1 [Olea europaea var. sylvestris]
MGSLDGTTPLKRDHRTVLFQSMRNSNVGGLLGFWPRLRSRFARLVFLQRINYLRCICIVSIVFFFIFLFQMFLLPGSVREGDKLKNYNFIRENLGGLSEEFAFLKELDFGDDIKFDNSKILAKFQKDDIVTIGSRNVVRFGYRNPKLALVFADLSVDPYQILMVTVASSLRAIGYEIEVFSLEDGPVHGVWRERGFPLNIMATEGNMKLSVDWLNYQGILVNSVRAASFVSCLMQEPFKNIPLIWTILEQTLAARLRQHNSSGKIELVDNWRKVFSRATVVVFPNIFMLMTYSACDSGNYFVIPGSPAEVWEADSFMALHNDNPRLMTEYSLDDLVVAVVSSQLLYKGLWLEHALVLQALYPVFVDFSSGANMNSGLKIIVLVGDTTSNYTRVVETIALNLRYPYGTVKRVAVDDNTENVLNTVDLVIYGSFLEEQFFPDILLKAMCFGKTIVAPDLSMIRKYVDDRVNGYLFPKENVNALTKIMFQIISNRKLSPLAVTATTIGKHTAKNLMVSESVEGYASLLENILAFPSEVATSRDAAEIPTNLKVEWQWHLFDAIANRYSQNTTLKNDKYLDKIEKELNHAYKESKMAPTATNDTLLYSIWEDQKYIDMANMWKRREEEELKDRTDQPRGIWDDVYRKARRIDWTKNELHERDEGELERTGQPLCIYEPYFGEGTWPFLHQSSLYRGLGLSTKGRRPGADDIDAPSRLPVLNNPYYRHVLGEHGAFFAIANRIDRIHKNAWIGFQSWRVTARKKSLSKTAERSILDAIEARRYGDSLYFWARLDKDPRITMEHDFWSFCDAINAGNCRFAFSEALKKMYGIKHDLSSLPPMPTDEDTWSVMNCWVLPTRSFLEYVMFSRMFVDALDSQFYEEHHRSGRCYLSLSKDKHCYSRVLELLVNVWAYHSARRMVYVDPETGFMQEQHKFKSRRGQMWVKWFQFSTLKSMDEDLAEELDLDHPKRRWLWPSTGEVFWQGIYEKEKNQRIQEKERRKKLSREKIKRMKKRHHQKTIGKYVKPPPDETESNSTVVAVRLLR